MGLTYKAKLMYGKLLTDEDEQQLVTKYDPDGEDDFGDILDGIFTNNYKEEEYAWYSIYGEETYYIITTKECILSAEFGPEEIDIPEVNQELKDKIDANWNKLGLEPKESKWYLGVHVW